MFIILSHTSLDHRPHAEEHSATPVSHPFTEGLEEVSREVLLFNFSPSCTALKSVLWKLTRSFLQSLTKIGQIVVEIQVRRPYSSLDLLLK